MQKQHRTSNKGNRKPGTCAAKKGEQRVDRRHNRPEQTAKNRKQTPGELNGKTTERRDAEKRQRRQNKRKKNEPKGRRKRHERTGQH